MLRVALALIGLLGAATAYGADERWAIVAKESSAAFRVRVLGIMPLAGAFAPPSGAIVIDRDAHTGSVEAVIRAATVTMSNPDNAAWARSPEFFDAEHHPEIRFRSDRFPLALLADGGELRGTLELRGHSETVTFEVEPGGRCDLDVEEQGGEAEPTPRGGRCEVVARGSIQRSVFGMTSRRAVSDRVTLRLRVVGRAT
ncbi:MAG TPA: YceI family protein [Xanthomonadales bacterium]|nr:YceI family protein [Xanthomonadales bacterium]